jgi:hypothetical protein
MPCRPADRGVLALEQAAEEGVLALIGGHLLCRTRTALVLGNPGKDLVDMLAAPGPTRLLATLAHHLSTHGEQHTPGGIRGSTQLAVPTSVGATGGRLVIVMSRNPATSKPA